MGLDDPLLSQLLEARYEWHDSANATAARNT